MAGATTSTITTRDHEQRRQRGSCFQDVPAKNRTANPMATYTSAVPRSGCGITIIAGISASSMIRAVVRRSCSRRERSTANAASDTISRILPNSEGWNWKNGSGIQRARPLHRRHPEHDQVQRDHQAVEAVLVLAQPRVVDPRQHQRQRPARSRSRSPGARRSTWDSRAATGLALERDQRAGDEPERRQQQQRIHPQPQPRGRGAAASSSAGRIAWAPSRSQRLRAPGDVRALACRRTTARGSGAPPARRRPRRSRPARP